MDASQFTHLKESKRLPRLLEFINANQTGHVENARFNDAKRDLGSVADDAKRLFSNHFDRDHRCPPELEFLLYSYGAISFVSQAKKLAKVECSHPAKQVAIQIVSELGALLDAMNAMKPRIISAAEARAMKKEQVKREEALKPVTMLSLIISEAVEKTRPHMEKFYQEVLEGWLEDLNRLNPKLLVLKATTEQERRARRSLGQTISSLKFQLSAIQLREVPGGTFDHDAVAMKIRAAKMATDALNVIKAKINQKLEDLDDGMVHSISNTEFDLRGKRGENNIQIKQTVKWNQSSLGMPYLQFPALIYVNGKSLSERKYKKMFEKQATQ